MKRLLLLLCFVAVLVLQSQQAGAAPDGIEVKPVRNYPSLDRGSTGTGTLTLTNKTTSVQDISMEVETFAVTNENYDYKFGTSEEVNWIVFDEPTFSLQPKQTKTVRYSIAVPGDAAAGGHYFSLLTTIVPPQDNPGVTEIRRVASLLYLEVSGSITKKSSLVSFSLPWFTTQPTIPADMQLSNNGTSHTRAKVLIEGRSVLSLIFRQPQQQYGIVEGTIMPATVRKLTTDVQLPGSPGIYQVSAKYSPTQGGKTEYNRTVLYAPIWFIVVIIVTLVGLIITIIRFTYPRIRRKTPKPTS